DLAGANAVLDQLDSPAVAAGNKEVAKLRARIADADRFPPALTAEHVKNVNEVKRLLVLANSQREIGAYDKALLTFQEVLRLDPYNTAARRGMETVEQDRSRYFDAARDHRRASMLNGVNEMWEAPVGLKAEDISNLFGASQLAQGKVPSGGREEITRKLRDLKISRIDFSGASLEEVVEYLRVRSRDLDPDGRGIDFVVSVSPDTPRQPVTLNLSNVPIDEVLRYVGQIAGVRHRVEEYAVRILSLTDDTGLMIAKSYRVPPDFITTAPVDAAAAAPNPFGQAPATGPEGLNFRRLGPREFLESRGVSFPEGSSASYSPVTNTLMIRNNAKNIELVDMLVEQALGTAPKQVVIEVRALDVGQSTLQELGFDWLLGGFNINADNPLVAGGTIGNQQSANFLTNNFPNQVGGVPIGQNPVTAGLRSSGDLTTNQTIDDVLYGAVTPATRRSPGTLSLTGVLTNPQFQMVVRALDQRTGIDLLVKPSVVTKSGQKATVQVVREMIYPTEFDPPQIPTTISPPPVIIIGVPWVAPPMVATPATPTAFEMRRVGVVLDVEPVISEDGRTIDLTITPEVTDFIGFVNYGSPIRSVNTTGTDFLEITENRIFQPIFSTRKIVTGVKVWDGATVVLGGLISDNTITIEDKVPVLGDTPLVGRLFRSNVKQRRMKNMLLFVTAKVIDPSGSRVHPEGR
ncbi:MAG TPA: Amuc_1098 family type IV pilus outer membrane protein, partial [Prosthecobacter sp.]|nr:Amuc_1098 family type IV pilus outer membrane protein [Prosthecobacter sp.]